MYKVKTRFNNNIIHTILFVTGLFCSILDDGLTTIGTHTSQPFVCLDRLGRECGNIMAAGLCNDNYVASFCQHTCNKCSDPGLIG